MQVLSSTRRTKTAGWAYALLAGLVAGWVVFAPGRGALTVPAAAQQRALGSADGDGIRTGVYRPQTSAGGVGETLAAIEAPAPRALDNRQIRGGGQIEGRPVRVRGLVVPQRQATISAAFAATIARIGPDNGMRFAAGDVLVAFDCGINQAELSRANALAEAARDTLRVRRKMASSGSISRLQVILAQADFKKADADVVVARTRVSYCRIVAPFAGRVVRRIANAYETVAPRDPLLEIVDDANIEIRVFVPSFWLKDLNLGDRFYFTVDETGQMLTVKIIALGASIDNVSQLVEVRGRVVAKFKTEPRAGQVGAAPAQTAVSPIHRQTRSQITIPLLAGMSGSADFSPLARRATAN